MNQKKVYDSVSPTLKEMRYFDGKTQYCSFFLDEYVVNSEREGARNVYIIFLNFLVYIHSMLLSVKSDMGLIFFFFFCLRPGHFVSKGLS